MSAVEGCPQNHVFCVKWIPCTLSEILSITFWHMCNTCLKVFVFNTHTSLHLLHDLHIIYTALNIYRLSLPQTWLLLSSLITNLIVYWRITLKKLENTELCLLVDLPYAGSKVSLSTCNMQNTCESMVKQTVFSPIIQNAFMHKVDSVIISVSPFW